MHGDMGGFYEVRADGPKRRHYRLFCLLARDPEVSGLDTPAIIVIGGLDKAFRTKLKNKDYETVRGMAEQLRSTRPWSVAD